MAKKKKGTNEPESKKDKAPWILMAMTVNLKEDDQKEQMAFVRTPEGDRWVPMSEAKGKFNLFEQLPEYQKELLARRIYEEILKKREEEKQA